MDSQVVRIFWKSNSEAEIAVAEVAQAGDDKLFLIQFWIKSQQSDVFLRNYLGGQLVAPPGADEASEVDVFWPRVAFD